MVILYIIIIQNRLLSCEEMIVFKIQYIKNRTDLERALKEHLR
jgi:hypothetical protein